jgi:hypothetical protein
MKKILILLAFLFITFISFAQTIENAYRIQSGVWNKYSKSWEWNDAINCNLDFTLSKKYISIDDKAHTFLTIETFEGEERNSESITNSWICYDEKNRRCTFFMTYYKGGQVIYAIMYSDVCWRYVIRSSGVDSYYKQ